LNKVYIERWKGQEDEVEEIEEEEEEEE